MPQNIERFTRDQLICYSFFGLNDIRIIIHSLFSLRINVGDKILKWQLHITWTRGVYERSDKQTDANHQRVSGRPFGDFFHMTWEFLRANSNSTFEFHRHKLM